MKITPIRTRIIQPPQDDLWSVLSTININQQDILVVSSKIISIHQGRCVKIDEQNKIDQKKKLISQEADQILPLSQTSNLTTAPLTKKYGVVVGSAGIDESNGDGYFILWPQEPDLMAQKIYSWLQQKFNLTNFGIIITDTIKRPFRRGAVGFAISHWGFRALRSYRGRQDIFGRTFKNETINLADSIASAAVLVMGEGNEQTPLAIVNQLSDIDFIEQAENLAVKTEDDYFLGLIAENKWEK